MWLSTSTCEEVSKSVTPNKIIKYLNTFFVLNNRSGRDRGDSEESCRKDLAPTVEGSGKEGIGRFGSKG